MPALCNKILLSIIALVAMSFSATVVDSENFSSPVSSKWQLKKFGAGYTVDTSYQNGWLRISSNGDFNYVQDSVSGYNTAGGIFRAIPNGDFTMITCYRQQDYVCPTEIGNKPVMLRTNIKAPDAAASADWVCNDIWAHHCWMVLLKKAQWTIAPFADQTFGDFNNGVTGGPIWVKISRTGTVFSFAASSDGSNWTTMCDTLHGKYLYMGLTDTYQNGYTEFDFVKVSYNDALNGVHYGTKALLSTGIAVSAANSRIDITLPQSYRNTRVSLYDLQGVLQYSGEFSLGGHYSIHAPSCRSQSLKLAAISSPEGNYTVPILTGGR